MEDSLPSSGFSTKTETDSLITKNKLSKRCSIAPLAKTSSQNPFKNIASLSHGRIGSDAVGHVALFVLKVAALETVRRFSRAKCPFAWQSIQALQVLCYPPFKWIQRFNPFKSLIKGIQVRNCIILSILNKILNTLMAV